MKEIFMKEIESMNYISIVKINIKECNKRIKEKEQGYNTCELSLDELKLFKHMLNKRLKELRG